MKDLKELSNPGLLIRTALIEAAQTDGLKRTQRWLAKRIDMKEEYLSNKLSGNDPFTQEEIDKINKVLGTEIVL